jgi:hypothetical protein
MQAMDVDLAKLENCIVRHLRLKWATAWKWDRRRCRRAFGEAPRPKEPTISPGPASDLTDKPSAGWRPVDARAHRLPRSGALPRAVGA